MISLDACFGFFDSTSVFFFLFINKPKKIKLWSFLGFLCLDSDSQSKRTGGVKTSRVCLLWKDHVKRAVLQVLTGNNWMLISVSRRSGVLKHSSSWWVWMTHGWLCDIWTAELLLWADGAPSAGGCGLQVGDVGFYLERLIEICKKPCSSWWSEINLLFIDSCGW